MHFIISKKVGIVYASLSDEILGTGLFEVINDSLDLGADMLKFLYPNAKIQGIGSVRLPTDKDLNKRGPLKWDICKQSWTEV